MASLTPGSEGLVGGLDWVAKCETQDIDVITCRMQIYLDVT